MTIEFGMIQGTSGAVPSYTAKNDRHVFAAQFDAGVFRGCRATGDTPARTVTIGLGSFAIDGTDGTLQGTYLGSVTVPEVVAIPAAPTSGTTIHWVCLVVQDLADGAGPALSNRIIAIVRSGTTGANTPPTLGASMEPIVQVSMAAGQTSVGPSQTVDLRRWGGPKAAVGALMDFYGPASRIPKNWAEMQGQVIGTATNYPELADHLGIASGNVTLPDARSRVFVGVDSSDGNIDAVGDVVGSKTTNLVGSMLPPHVHTIIHDHAGITGYESNGHVHAGSGTTEQEGSHVHGTPYAPGAGDEFVVIGPNSFSPHPHRGYVGGLGSSIAGGLPFYGKDAGEYTVANAGTLHVHPFVFTSNDRNASHTHLVATNAQTATDSGNGPGSSQPVSVVQPSMAVRHLMRVA